LWEIVTLPLKPHASASFPFLFSSILLLPFFFLLHFFFFVLLLERPTERE
jgi:hypothetical protein